MQINQYPVEATTVISHDLLDFEKQLSPGVWQSQKLRIDTLAGGIASAFPELFDNIYTANGSLPENRVIDQDGFDMAFTGGQFMVGTTSSVFPFRLQVSGNDAGVDSQNGIYISSTGNAIFAGSANGNTIVTNSGTGRGFASYSPANIIRKDAIGSIPAIDPSSIWDVYSDDQGARPVPRITESQRDSIVTPGDYLEITNTTTNRKEFYHPIDGWVSLVDSHTFESEVINSTESNIIHGFNTISCPIQDFVHEFSVTTDSTLIREIGNLFIDDNGDRYFTYSAGASPYNATNMPWIYCVKSIDGGITWTELGKITGQGFEDPYLIKSGANYMLYSEKKVGAVQGGINLHQGTDILSLIDMGLVVSNSSDPLVWDALDRSSPAVIELEGEFIMLFEGRASSGQQGAIGKATSLDGITWTIETDPLIVGYEYAYINPYNLRLPYVSHLVPDTITNIGSKYLLSFHAYNGNAFTTVLLLTEDFINYEDYLGTWIGVGLENRETNGSGIAVFTDGGSLKALMTSRKENNILNPFILQEAKFSVKNGNYSRYAVKTTGIYKIVPAQRSEYILFNSTSPTSATLANDLNSGAGLVKTIKNSKTGDITINCETGVDIDTLSSLVIAKDTEIALVSTAVNSWTVFSKHTKGVSGTYTFNTSSPGQVASIVVVDGVITQVVASV